MRARTIRRWALLALCLSGSAALVSIAACEILIGAAIVALVAANFPSERRSAAYGLIAAAGGCLLEVRPDQSQGTERPGFEYWATR